MKHYAAEALARYFEPTAAVAQLPIPASRTRPHDWEPRLASVSLPDWGQGGVDSQLLVPRQALAAGTLSWEQVDWWGAVFWYLTAQAEQRYEEQHGPVHSYSYPLVAHGFDERMWQRAWVNRIGLFLRSWLEQKQRQAPLGPGKIWLVHDVDALRKTPAIRFKQSLFHLVNAFRYLSQGRWKAAKDKFLHGLRFLLSQTDYWAFEEICRLEDQYGFRSQFLFYGGQGGPWRSPVRQLFDPDYDVRTPRAAQKIAELKAGGWQVGLHQSFQSWQRASDMADELRHLETLATPIDRCCRQHWLRFSWKETWPAQEEAGLCFDSTLGYNDRPGFRNAAALSFTPFGLKRLQCVPMVVTDSQLYDYCLGQTPCAKKWLQEVADVHGEACVVWHQQVFNSDYGWADGYVQLLQDLATTPNLVSALRAPEGSANEAPNRAPHAP